MGHEKSKELILCKEYKIHELLPDVNKEDDLEASRVYAKDDQIFVIFDNATNIGQISNWIGNITESWAVPTVRLGTDPVNGFEDNTFDPKLVSGAKLGMSDAQPV